MEDPTLVRVREGGSDLDPEVQHGFRRQPVCRQQRVERFAFDRLHGDVGLAIGLAHFEHGADVRMVQGGGGTRLVQQAGARDGVLHAMRRQHLERDFPLELLVASTVDDAHAPGADRVEHRVVGESPADHGPEGTSVAGAEAEAGKPASAHLSRLSTQASRRRGAAS